MYIIDYIKRIYIYLDIKVVNIVRKKSIYTRHSHPLIAATHYARVRVAG